MTAPWLTLLLAIALSGLTAVTDGKARPDAANPHGAAAACNTCHAMTGGTVGAPSLAASTCLDCHPNADHHPIGVAPASLAIPTGWPLSDGQLTCATCHEESSCASTRKGGSNLLRGGPVANTKDFCYRCHERQGFTRESPHAPATPRDASDTSCAACHSGIPETGAAVADARLRFGLEDGNCTECHDGPVHQGLAFHLGHAVPTLSAAAAERMAVDAQGRLRCYTCHEVHGATAERKGKQTRLATAVAARAAESWDPWVAAARASDQHSALGALLAFPVEDGSLCQACHGVGP